MAETLTLSTGKLLVYKRIDDLYIADTKARYCLNFLSMLVQLEVEHGGQLDFICLPGSMADNGGAEQYRGWGPPRCASPASLAARFRATTTWSRVARSTSTRGWERARSRWPWRHGGRCLFLSVCGPGRGGPDFRLGVAPLTWLREQLGQVPAGTEVALFMHTYPADLRAEAARRQVTALLAQHRVALVDRGHTYHNELANDGATIYVSHYPFHRLN
ncbi:hypothetical protein ACFQ48_05905 [Hymenobacter caeli]|uniref:Calcineurin-like phosphoesterase domain-containing protein n=1 Tax=Hymenobacter caeli TaxID=2735894 RepID=A0ABX2FN40_9BACT|nr:hypothetical protein [Hymenobacter caeli]NRT18585.1 hypothetical protein [Hymenobacter caeli]